MNNWIKQSVKKEMLQYCEDKDLEYGFSRSCPIEMDDRQLEHCIGWAQTHLKLPTHSVLVEGCRRIAHVTLCRIRTGHTTSEVQWQAQIQRQRDAIGSWKGFEARYGYNYS